jgi:D-alanyl-D-alanine carboxypeptidase (penicillin-binding protein 5/6)
MALWPGQSVFGLDKPDAANAGLDPGPQIYAKSAIVYCENTGETVYGRESRTKRPPNSLAMLTTALVVIQNVPLNKVVKVSARAASQKGSKVGLQKGEKLTVEQLLYGMLLDSGNDAAYALAECVSGDKQDKFVHKMNKLAENLGCENTRFSDPAGYKSDGTYTTASDFLRILRGALSDETVGKIASTAQHNMPRTNKSASRLITSKVPLMNQEDSGVYGGQDGFLTQSQSSVAVGYRKNGLHLYIVLLDDTDLQREVDIRTLTDYAEKQVQGIPVIREGKAVGKVRIRHGAKTRLTAYAARDGYAYLPDEGSVELVRHQVDLKEVDAPVKAGDVVGYYNIRIGNEISNRVPLVIRESVETGWFPSYIGISNRTTVIILVILSVILLFVLWIVILRRRAKRRRERLRRKQIRERARQKYLDEEDHRKRHWTFDK